MKILGLDVGAKRIGVAKVDTEVAIAVPEPTINVDGTEFEQLKSLSRLLKTDFFVLGLPRNSAGVETAQSKYVRDFATKLKQAIPAAKIRFQDESLTSVIAEERLSKRHQPFHKGEVDAEAATIILQDFIDSYAKKNFKTESPMVNSSKIKSRSPKSSKPQAPKTRKKLRLVSFFILIALTMGAFLGYNWYHTSLQPVMSPAECKENSRLSGCQPLDFEVSESSSTKNIAKKLEETGIIKSSLAFQIHLFQKKAINSLKPGVFSLSKTMSVPEIIEVLQKSPAGSNVLRLTFLPGETLRDIKNKLIKVGYSGNEVDAAFKAKYKHPLLADLPAGASLEGYIYGDTYEFYRGAPISEIIQKTLDHFHKILIKEDLINRFSAQGLSLHQGIILASVVQKEAHSQDQPAVARVFLNRLKKGMMLGSDVTVQYALDQVDPERRQYRDNASKLNIDSCYNTRLHPGLPCGPISNPGLSALKAVANPSQNDYLYFLTGDDGLMYYSRDDAGHQKNISSHCRKLCGVSL